MVLDSSALAVELVVDDPRGLGFGAVEAALNGRADRGGASLLRGTLGKAGNVTGQHGRRWCGWFQMEGRSYVEVQAALVDSHPTP